MKSCHACSKDAICSMWEELNSFWQKIALTHGNKIDAQISTKLGEAMGSCCAYFDAPDYIKVLPGVDCQHSRISTNLTKGTRVCLDCGQITGYRRVED